MYEEIIKQGLVSDLTHIKHLTKYFVFVYDCKSESRRGRFIHNRSEGPSTSFQA